MSSPRPYGARHRSGRRTHRARVPLARPARCRFRRRLGLAPGSRGRAGRARRRRVRVCLRLPVCEVEKDRVHARLRLARFYEMTVSGVAVNNVLPGASAICCVLAGSGSLPACPPGGHSEPWCSTAHATSSFSSPCSLSGSPQSRAPSGSSVSRPAGSWSCCSRSRRPALRARVHRPTRARAHSRGLVRRLVRDAVEVLAEPLGRRLPVVARPQPRLRGTWAIAAFLIARSLDIELSVPKRSSSRRSSTSAPRFRLHRATSERTSGSALRRWVSSVSRTRQRWRSRFCSMRAWYVPTTLGRRPRPRRARVRRRLRRSGRARDRGAGRGARDVMNVGLARSGERNLGRETGWQRSVESCSRSP